MLEAHARPASAYPARHGRSSKIKPTGAKLGHEKKILSAVEQVTPGERRRRQQVRVNVKIEADRGGSEQSAIGPR